MKWFILFDAPVSPAQSHISYILSPSLSMGLSNSVLVYIKFDNQMVRPLD